ncbi:Guanine nucleotide-binding-like protein 1 [Geranomyces michiganensis]|nr:Guanine nucleotide-binding-like protein 1 [Geranomyces michiganensis]
MGARKKTPFSQKAKKQQLKDKRARNAERDDAWGWEDDELAPAVRPGHGQHNIVDKSTTVIFTESGSEANTESASEGGKVAAEAAYGKGELESVFAKLPPDVIDRRKKESTLPLVRLPASALEVSFEDLYTADAVIDIPKRPAWSYGESKQELEEREELYFKKWMSDVYRKHRADELSYFEHNLEVWRQLWRVVEISDIILFIVDVRHPVLHFPPSLYDYVVKELNRKLVLVFNKIDLVTPETLDAWTRYFLSVFPQLTIARFSQYAKEEFLQSDEYAPVKPRGKRSHKTTTRAVGIPEILKACRDVHLVKSGVRVEWQELIDRAVVEAKKRDEEARQKEEDQTQGKRRRRLARMGEKSELEDGDISGSETDESSDEADTSVEPDTSLSESAMGEPHSEWVTLGLIGHPNVGKSSLINGLMGKKVVSTSRTPGHTKHFQTIHLTANVRLCDCPGLVFPSIVPKPLQILSGMYRISQVQEPYTAVAYLAARVPLETILALHHPDQDERPEGWEWSAWKICEAFAWQRGFLTSRAARPDVYRAANMILRMCADGRILLSSKPKGFAEGKWCTVDASANGTKEVADTGESDDEGDSTDSADGDGPVSSRGAFDLLAEEES